MESLQNKFLKGKLQELTEYFQLPLVIYAEEDVFVLRDEEKLQSVLKIYHGAISALSPKSTRVEILNREDLPGDRARMTVRVRDIDASGQEVYRSVIRYFLANISKKPAIEMLEYIDLPLAFEEMQNFLQ